MSNSRTMLALFSLLTLLLTTAPSTLMAQSYSGGSSSGVSVGAGGPAALTPGTWGLSLGVLGNNPYANNTANISYFATGQFNIGLSLGLRIENGDDQLSNYNPGVGGGEWSLALAPMIRYYIPRGHRVVPYIFAKANFAMSDLPPLDQYFGLEGGLGAEFFAYDYFSVSGYIGMNINMIEDFGLGLFTSAMMANFYF